MPIKIGPEKFTQPMPTSANVKFVLSNGNEKTVKIIEYEKSNYFTTIVWQKRILIGGEDPTS